MIPFQHKSFEKRGCPVAFFVSKLWSFEVGICVQPSFAKFGFCSCARNNTRYTWGLTAVLYLSKEEEKLWLGLIVFRFPLITTSCCNFHTLDCAFCLMNLWAKLCIVHTQCPNYFSHHFFPPRAPLRAAGWVEEQGGGLHLPARPSRCFVARAKSYWPPLPDWPGEVIAQIILTQVELSMTYGCEDQLSRKTLLRYIHQNRNYNSLKINTMGGYCILSSSK